MSETADDDFDEYVGKHSPLAGSFPLMGIAKRFGVDYGDVLLVAQGMAARTTELSAARWEGAIAAHRRIDAAIQASAPDPTASVARWYDFGALMTAHAKGRWGKRP